MAEKEQNGSALREVREARGWSQQDLAERADISVAMVSRLESGHREPSNALVFVLATVFGKRISEVAAWFEDETKEVA